MDLKKKDNLKNKPRSAGISKKSYIYMYEFLAIEKGQTDPAHSKVFSI